MSWTKRHIGTEECILRLPEIPSKARPRYDRRHGRTYTPVRSQRAEKRIRDEWLRKVGDQWSTHTGEVYVLIQAQRPLAKSNPKRWVGRADLMKPDADNLAKIICDALNGLAYADDRQITRLGVTYDPRVPHRDTCLIRVRVDYYTETYTKE